MREFTMLIGQILFIALLQNVLELIIDKEKRPEMVKFLNIACILGSLTIILQYVYNHIMGQLTAFVTFPF